MPDEKAGALLAAINGICKEGGFKIVEEDDLLSPLLERGEIGELLERLEAERLIEIRYAEEGVYCLRPLPEGRRYSEAQKESRLALARSRRETALLSFLGAFAGSALAMLLALLVFLLTEGI